MSRSVARVTEKVALATALALLSSLGFPAVAGRADPIGGGLTVAHRAGGKPTPSDRNAPRVVVSRTGYEAGEPTLGVTQKGDIFYVAFRDNLRVEVLRSRNEGRSWEVVSPNFGEGIRRHLVSFDPYLYVDEATDRVFTVDLTVACSYLSSSDDDGKTWSTNPLACGRPVNDHQTLFAGPPVTSDPRGYPRVLYYCWNDVASSSCSKSLDGGMTFAPTGEPAYPGYDGSSETSETWCGGLHGHGVVGPDGTVYLPREHCKRPFLAISADEGVTWQRSQVSGEGVADGTDPSVAVDAIGNLYYGWVGKDRLPYLSISRDGGQTWGKPAMIAAPQVQEANLLTIDVGAPGKVAFAYMGTTDDRHPKTWDGYLAITVDALGKDPAFFTGTVNYPGDPLKRGTCGPGRCGEEVLDFIDITIAPDGKPWAAFVDACDARCARSGLEGGNEGIAAFLVGGPSLLSKASLK